MSYTRERVIIETLFKAEWVNGNVPLTPVAYDEQDITTPTDGSPWIRLDIQSGAADAVSVGTPGTNAKRYVGAVAVQINTKVGGGSALARTFADKVEAIFNRKIIENITFGVTYAAPKQQIFGIYSSWTIWCPFTRDEFNS